MNDLPYIFYRPRDMYLDTIGLSKEGKVAHRQLADYIWFNDGPPANDNENLREISSCALSDWSKVKRELIGKGWMETPKFFLHKGIIKTLNYSKKKAVENHNQTAALNKLPRKKLLAPDPETGVTHYVTLDATQNDSGGVTLSPSPSISLSEIPTLEEAFNQTMSAGIPKDFCQYVFDDWSSRSGKDGGGNIVAWLPYVGKRWTREQGEWKAGTHKGKKTHAKKVGGNF